MGGIDQGASQRPLALVTGAARRLGRALAFELARQGYAVAVHYCRSAEQAEATAGELRRLGAPAYPLRADLAHPEEIAALFEQVDGLPHPLKILVNSAGVMTRASLSQITVEDWDATLAVNLRAPMLCAQHAARRMADGGGLIVNLSDAGVSRAWTGYPAYLISKAGLEALTRILARSLAPAIRVNAIAPGLVMKSDGLPGEQWDRLVERVPLKRAADPEEICQALAFILSNQYMTGQTIVVDGGFQVNA